MHRFESVLMYEQIVKRFVLILALSLFCLQVSAQNADDGVSRPVPQGVLGEAFENLLERVVRSPSVISQQGPLLRQLTANQLSRLINKMELTHFTFLYPVRVKGEKIPSLLGKSMDSLSVMSVWNGRLQAIPFQFDEFDVRSRYIYIEGVNPYPVDGTRRVIDGGDELIFMYRDAGVERFKKSEMILGQGEVLRELVFTDRQHRKRYAYIVANNYDRSRLDYVNSDIKASKITTSFYHMAYKEKNFLEFEDFQPHLGAAADERVVDNIYFDMSANVFSKFINIGLNSADNIRIKVLGEKDGPVRSTLFIKIVFVLGRLPVFSMFSEVNIYEQGMVMPNRTEVGKGSIFVKLFKNPRIRIYLDMHSLNGGRVSAASFVDDKGKLKYGIIDGKMDAVELDANKVKVPGDWIWMNSGLGWDVFMALSFPEENLEGMETSIYYLDDKTHLSSHETFPGAEPRIGMRIIGLPDKIDELENLDLEYAFWYPDTVGSRGPREFNRELRNKPRLKVMNIR